jgi:hypothetical protein
MTYKTWNEIKQDNNNHLDNIIDSLHSNGWIGLPLLAINDQLLTGSHRYVACQIAGIAPDIHQCVFTNPTGDDYIARLINDLTTVCNDSNDLLYVMLLLRSEKAIDDISVIIMQAESEKE